MQDVSTCRRPARGSKNNKIRAMWVNWGSEAIKRFMSHWESYFCSGWGAASSPCINNRASQLRAHLIRHCHLAKGLQNLLVHTIQNVTQRSLAHIPLKEAIDTAHPLGLVWEDFRTLVACLVPLLCKRPLVWLPSTPLPCIFPPSLIPLACLHRWDRSELASSSQARRADAKSLGCKAKGWSRKRVLGRQPELFVIPASRTLYAESRWMAELTVKLQFWVIL